MSYLSRESSPLPEEFWEKIDATVVASARKMLTGRRFLSVSGPLGAGVADVALDDIDAVEEAETDGLITTRGRKFVEIPMVYADFTLLAKDLERAEVSSLPLDLSRAAKAAEECAIKEDKLIFLGNEKLGYEGLLTVSGANRIKKKDWSAGENAFEDIAAGIAYFAEKGIYGDYALVVSPRLFMQLQRLQPGTGLLEADRISRLVGGRLYQSQVLGADQAVLVASDEKNMDLVIGQDMATAYLEQKDLNHSFRVLETVLPRIKQKQAVVVFA
ncbi:family 1 encapsulin nanocompartment shell protein [Faecalispora jeddahensis]|uniref:family 1 encapsulin nanocompartment shell protein n=1 Tax=Faecalispora jeddahensis TaxID=1414721 RepID=UPI00145B13A7|nr:family 1 encapsulin nanocompartment shell protein [Faecalispora jeddahensis]